MAHGLDVRVPTHRRARCHIRRKARYRPRRVSHPLDDKRSFMKSSHTVNLRAYTESHRDSQYAKDVRSSQFYKAMEKEGDFPVYVATATVYFDDPGKGLGKTREEVAFMNELLRPYFDNLDHELVIITPYFVPGDDGVQKALDVVKRGISVVVITNSYGSTDNVAVSWFQ